jgi:hypothetical protein
MKKAILGFVVLSLALCVVLFVLHTKGKPTGETPVSDRSKASTDPQANMEAKSMENAGAKSSPSLGKTSARGPAGDKAVGSAPEDFLDFDIGQIQIDDLKRRFDEKEYQITELPPPSGPVKLEAKYNTDAEHKRHKSVGYMIEEFPWKMRTGRLVVNDTVLLDIDNVKSTALVQENLKTLVSFSVMDGKETSDRAGGVEIEKQFVLTRSGQRIPKGGSGVSAEKLSGNMNFSGNTDSITMFPTEPLDLNKEYSLEVPMGDMQISEAIKDEPASLKLRLTKRVAFKGIEAYEIQVNQVSYSILAGPMVEKPIHSKINTTGKYYVDAASGQILWRNFESHIVNSDSNYVNGMAMYWRDALVQ